MAKQIIVLDRSDVNRFRVAYWLVPPVARRPFYANATASSQYLQITGPELSAIQSGAVVEKIFDKSYPVAQSITATKAALVTDYAAQQAIITAYNPWDFYGTTFDGTLWTDTGIA